MGGAGEGYHHHTCTCSKIMVDLKRQVNYVHCKHSVEGSYNVALEKKRTLPSSWLQGNVTLFPKNLIPGE